MIKQSRNCRVFSTFLKMRPPDVIAGVQVWAEGMPWCVGCQILLYAKLTFFVQLEQINKKKMEKVVPCLSTCISILQHFAYKISYVGAYKMEWYIFAFKKLYWIVFHQTQFVSHKDLLLFNCHLYKGTHLKDFIEISHGFAVLPKPFSTYVLLPLLHLFAVSSWKMFLLYITYLA